MFAEPAARGRSLLVGRRGHRVVGASCPPEQQNDDPPAGRAPALPARRAEPVVCDRAAAPAGVTTFALLRAPATPARRAERIVGGGRSARRRVEDDVASWPPSSGNERTILSLVGRRRCRRDGQSGRLMTVWLSSDRLVRERDDDLRFASGAGNAGATGRAGCWGRSLGAAAC